MNGIEKQSTLAHNRAPTGIQTNTFSKMVLCIYFALSIFEPYLNGILGSLTKYYIFFTILVLIYQNKWKIYLTQTSKAMMLWLIFKFISLIWSQDYATPRLHYISQLGMVMFLVVLFSYDYEEDTLDWIEITYWVSSAVIGVLSLFFSKSYLGSVAVRQVLVIAGVEVDPNNQAVLLLVGICISLVNLFFKRKWIPPSVIILLINIYGCFMTGSRAALATILLVALFCLILPGEKRRATAVIRRVLLVVLIFISALYLIQQLSPAIYDRLFNIRGYTGGSGRSLQWSNVWKVYTADLLNILIGLGWGSSTALTGAYTETGAGLGVHNTFLTMLCDVGLIGTLLFNIPLIHMSLSLIRRKEYYPVMMLLTSFTCAFFIDAINKRFFWNAIFILGMYYYHYIVNKKDGIDNTR